GGGPTVPQGRGRGGPDPAGAVQTHSSRPNSSRQASRGSLPSSSGGGRGLVWAGGGSAGGEAAVGGSPPASPPLPSLTGSPPPEPLPVVAMTASPLVSEPPARAAPPGRGPP